MGGVWVKDLVIVLKYFVSKLSMDEVFFLYIVWACSWAPGPIIYMRLYSKIRCIWMAYWPGVVEFQDRGHNLGHNPDPVDSALAGNEWGLLPNG